ncbi:hypothetical protein ScPMuIL_010052 [Solemya velum]
MKDNNTCFYGVCHYCNTPVCGNGTILEGTIILWLPEDKKLKLHYHPWRRTYKKNKQPRWEKTDGYCDAVKDNYQQNLGSEDRLLDIIDTTILDYLIGNADRHNYEIFENISDAAMLIMDNAKSVGNPYKDERSILAPLYQCCRLRYSTWQRLLVLQEGILSQSTRKYSVSDPIAPVQQGTITDLHLTALDRRLENVIREIENLEGLAHVAGERAIKLTVSAASGSPPYAFVTKRFHEDRVQPHLFDCGTPIGS